MVRAGTSLLVVLSAVVAGCGVASGQTTYGGGAGATVTTTSACQWSVQPNYGDPSNPCTASPYPSTIAGPASTATVDLSAPISSPFSVKISGIQAPYTGLNGPCWGTSDLGFLLKGPGGQMLEFMSAAGGYGQSVTGGYVTLSSGSATELPRPFLGADTWPSGKSMSGDLGTYAPGSFLADAGAPYPAQDAYPGQAALSSSTMAAANGAGTFSSVFDGAQANGNWSLYLIDYDGPGCTASFTGWTLSFASTGTSNDTTSTTVSSATVNPLTKESGNSVTFTATVTNTGGSATPAGTVTFTSTPYPSGTPTTLCSAASLSGSGNTATASCAADQSKFAAEGIYEINATYTPGTGFSGSNTISPYYEWVNNPTTSGGTDFFCNTGTITGSTETTMSPFPSVVTVTGITNAVQNVTVQLNNYSFADEGRDTVLLLQAPTGAAMVLMSDLGGGSGTTTNTGSVTFSDSGAPATGANPFVGNGALTLAPTALVAIPGAFIQTLPATPPSGEPTLPATAASGTYVGIGIPATVGTATLFSTFNGVAANGTWSLFALTANQLTKITDGWCLGIIAASGVATTTVVSGSPNPAATGAAVADHGHRHQRLGAHRHGRVQGRPDEHDYFRLRQRGARRRRD
jgi:hypothetical protein